MIIEFKCSHCQVLLKAESNLSGQKGTCSNCKKEVTVPEKSEEIQDKTEEATKKE